MQRDRCISMAIRNMGYGPRAIIDAVRDEHNEIPFRIQWERYDDEKDDTWERVDEFVRTHPDCPALPITSELFSGGLDRQPRMLSPSSSNHNTSCSLLGLGSDSQIGCYAVLP